MTPARLQKPKTETSVMAIFNKPIVIRLGLLICMILLFCLITALAYAIIGVSATESGTVYNHLDKVI